MPDPEDFEADGHQAELLAPVAEVVDAFHPVAEVAVEIGQRVAEHCRPDVVEADGFGDVGGAVAKRWGT